MNEKKNFSCNGSEFSHHPKVFFTVDFKEENNQLNCSPEKKIKNLDKSIKKDQNQASCPYCGKIFYIND